MVGSDVQLVKICVYLGWSSQPTQLQLFQRDSLTLCSKVHKSTTSPRFLDSSYTLHTIIHTKRLPASLYHSNWRVCRHCLLHDAPIMSQNIAVNEKDILKPVSQEDDPDDWPCHILQQAVIFSDDRKSMVNLLEAELHGPFIVQGKLEVDKQYKSQCQSILKDSCSKLMGRFSFSYQTQEPYYRTLI